MEGVFEFKVVAPYLTHPLVLVGLVLLLVFGIHRALLKAGIIAPLTQQTDGKVVQSFPRYGFVIALLMIVLGFIFAFYQTHLEHSPDVQKGRAEKARMEGLVAMANGFCQQPGKKGLNEATLQDMVRACTEAIHALSQTRAPEPQIEAALYQLSMGHDQLAKAIFEQVLERKSAEGSKANREAATAERHLGALAFKSDTKVALAAYQKAAQLDPENPDGWNRLGHLFLRTGELRKAEAAYRRVKQIGESNRDRTWIAIAYGNLGIVYKTRGELEQAETMYKKALALDEALGRKVGMDNAYGNLGIVYKTRGELEQAETMYKKALELNEALVRKEGMANAYGSLGIVYETRGELEQAETMYKKALELNEALGRKLGMANAYGSLGIVYQMRGELEQAETMYKKALALFSEVGAVDQSKKTQGLLDRLSQSAERSSVN